MKLFDRIQGRFARLRVILARQAYAGALVELAERLYGWVLQIVRRDHGQRGFQVLPKRWVVERTFGWFESYRRLSKAYEYLPEKSEAMIELAMVRLMVNRLC